MLVVFSRAKQWREVLYIVIPKVRMILANFLLLSLVLGAYTCDVVRLNVIKNQDLCLRIGGEVGRDIEVLALHRTYVGEHCVKRRFVL